MNIEDQLRSSFRSVMGPGHDATTEKQYEQFLEYYRNHATDTVLTQANELDMLETKYGLASYYLGVHFASVQRSDLAEPWLRDAAERDIGDASFRLAQLYESDAVTAFNRHLLEGTDLPSPIDEKFSEAYYWYRRAAVAGYAVEDYPGPDRLDLPLVSLDCCNSTRALAAEERAKRELQEAKDRRDAMLRDVRSDVASVIERARDEVSELALKHERLSREIANFEGTLDLLKKLLDRPIATLPHLAVLVIRSRFSQRDRASLARVYAVYCLAVTEGASAGAERGRSNRFIRKLRKRLTSLVRRSSLDMEVSISRPVLDEAGARVRATNAPRFSAQRRKVEKARNARREKRRPGELVGS